MAVRETTPAMPPAVSARRIETEAGGRGGGTRSEPGEREGAREGRGRGVERGGGGWRGRRQGVRRQKVRDDEKARTEENIYIYIYKDCRRKKTV